MTTFCRSCPSEETIESSVCSLNSCWVCRIAVGIVDSIKVIDNFHAVSSLHRHCHENKEGHTTFNEKEEGDCCLCMLDEVASQLRRLTFQATLVSLHTFRKLLSVSFGKTDSVCSFHFEPLVLAL